MSMHSRARPSPLDEGGRARLVGDVEGDCDIGVDSLDAPRSAHDPDPDSRSLRTVEAPIPLDAPVTIAVFPSRFTARAYETGDCTPHTSHNPFEGRPEHDLADNRTMSEHSSTMPGPSDLRSRIR